MGGSAPIAPDVTSLAGSQPENGATDVPVEISIALRFSQGVRVTTLTTRTVTLAGPEGAVRAAVTPGDEGRLAFLAPLSPLNPGV